MTHGALETGSLLGTSRLLKDKRQGAQKNWNQGFWPVNQGGRSQDSGHPGVWEEGRPCPEIVRVPRPRSWGSGHTLVPIWPKLVVLPMGNQSPGRNSAQIPRMQLSCPWPWIRTQL